MVIVGLLSPLWYMSYLFNNSFTVISCIFLQCECSASTDCMLLFNKAEPVLVLGLHYIMAVRRLVNSLVYWVSLTLMFIAHMVPLARAHGTYPSPAGVHWCTDTRTYNRFTWIRSKQTPASPSCIPFKSTLSLVCLKRVALWSHYYSAINTQREYESNFE